MAVLVGLDTTPEDTIILAAEISSRPQSRLAGVLVAFDIVHGGTTPEAHEYCRRLERDVGTPKSRL